MKKIILCADGTWNTPHGPSQLANDTNARKLYRLLQASNSQLRYYDSGVGTGGTPFEHFFGGAFGEGLFQKIKDGYQFLSYVWDPSDEIYIFGFSRGAYTARSLAGMIAAFGAPTKDLDNQTVDKIFAAYRITDKNEREVAKARLIEQYDLNPVTVRMLGVWDTVGALGIPGHLFAPFDEEKYGFLDTTLNPNVQKAYHAVSIDERRASFRPTLWTEADGSPRPNDDQMQQVWFPGVHSDVGGGYADDRLSNITLKWMIDKAKGCGLLFDDSAVAQCLGAAPFDPLGPAHDEWKLIPWGPPSHRVVPSNAVMSSTVQLRIDHAESAYLPANLSIGNGKLEGYGTEVVLPNAAP